MAILANATVNVLHQTVLAMVNVSAMTTETQFALAVKAGVVPLVEVLPVTRPVISMEIASTVLVIVKVAGPEKTAKQKSASTAVATVFATTTRFSVTVMKGGRGKNVTSVIVVAAVGVIALKLVANALNFPLVTIANTWNVPTTAQVILSGATIQMECADATTVTAVLLAKISLRSSASLCALNTVPWTAVALSLKVSLPARRYT